MDWATIRRYSHYRVPVLRKCGKRIDSLREITPKDVEDVVTAHTGNPAHGVHGALRSLFRALKRERVIFRGPARNVSVTYANRAPRRIPSDRLAGLLDRAPTAMAKAVVALVAIHALGSTEIRRLHLMDLNRSAGRLIARRRGDKHNVYLDELTLELLTDWLRERYERWPHSTNPHLFVTQVTALDPEGPPVAKCDVQPIFTQLGSQRQKLRIDRILAEAHETADPVHLMRLRDRTRHRDEVRQGRPPAPLHQEPHPGVTSWLVRGPACHSATSPPTWACPLRLCTPRSWPCVTAGPAHPARDHENSLAAKGGDRPTVAPRDH
ncbi:hypothetical protein [Streptomyces rubradiris]|uniref:hypothetical protein n=1 Tax=Streptomyces rubradiris TaxID=285531 RepID=UPI001E3CA1BD|nr:hypothetical protein [Streptomyces rubradiris]